MTNDLISIVIPIYNIEQYLTKCLDSIVAQTYSNIEILLINDGSSDNSGVICDEYAAKESRIKVFHSENRGVARARQLGVENSSGEYIIFVDSDDWIPKCGVESLYSNMDSHIDIVVGGYSLHEQSKTTLIEYKPTIYSGEQLLNLIMGFDIYVAPWGKIYRRSLFTQDSFPARDIAEDYLMNIEVSTRVRNIKLIDKIVYCYRYNDNYATKRVYRTFEYQMQLCKSVKDILLKSNIELSKYRVAYAKCTLASLTKLLPFKVAIDCSNPVIVDMYTVLGKEQLTIKQRIKLLAIRNSIARRLLILLWYRAPFNKHQIR